MGRKGKSRYTAEERAIHEEAVRLRKMTDKQLVEGFHRAADAEIAVRVPDVVQDDPEEADHKDDDTADVQKLLSALSEGRCKGIKGATVYKITEFATEMGLI